MAQPHLDDFMLRDWRRDDVENVSERRQTDAFEILSCVESGSVIITQHTSKEMALPSLSSCALFAYSSTPSPHFRACSFRGRFFTWSSTTDLAC